jgi:FtsP/CotA-like multicopper oxidase with cupredoxin domain
LSGCTPLSSGGPDTGSRPSKPAHANKTVQVELEAAAGEVDLGAGVRATTWSYGGQVPGREIRVTAGDLLQVKLNNRLPTDTTVHWHGIALRNDMDGVPHLTQQPIAAAASHQYEFTVPDSGTYFYHPHVGVQLDRGLYAPLIVEDPDERGDYDDEVVVVFDDWTDGVGRDPDQVLADLRGTTAPAMDHGQGSAETPTPGHGIDHDSPEAGTDASTSLLFEGQPGHVQYPHYLANGRVPADPHVIDTRPGRRLRLRLINAGADTAFRIAVPGASMTVTHTDGFPVRPTVARSVLLGMGERLDAIVTVPATSTPVLALPEGKDGHAQLILRVPGSNSPDPAAVHHAVQALPMVTAVDLTAADAVALTDRAPDVTYELTLNGPGNNFTWTINGRTYDPDDVRPVRQGQRVRLSFANFSRMFHPMHLHGHTFQVRNGAALGPRKDTVIVLPGQLLDVDFDAVNPGKWMTHCHNVYHGEAGMMTTLSYVP